MAQRPPDRIGWLDRPGLRLFWRAWLPASDPAAIILLHHGLGEHSDRYPHVVRQLVATGYPVVAFDARGHGRSSGRRGSFDRFEQLVEDFTAVREQVVRPLYDKPLVAMGYSLGGLVAMAYILSDQHEAAATILIGSALGRGDGVSGMVMSGAAVLSAMVPRFPLVRLRATDMITDAHVAREYDSDPLVHHRKFDARTLGEILAAGPRLSAQAVRLRMPLLLIHGTADITASPDRSRQVLEQAGSADKTLKLYDARRHDLLNDVGHDVVVADIVGWLTARF